MEGNSQARVGPSIIHERLLICTHGHGGCGVTNTEGWDCVGGELNNSQNPKTTQPSQEKGQRRHVPTSISVLYGGMWDPPANFWTCYLVLCSSCGLHKSSCEELTFWVVLTRLCYGAVGKSPLYRNSTFTQTFPNSMNENTQGKLTHHQLRYPNWQSREYKITIFSLCQDLLRSLKMRTG